MLRLEIDAESAEFGTVDRVMEIVARFPGNAPVTVSVRFGGEERILHLAGADEFDARLMQALEREPGVTVDEGCEN